MDYFKILNLEREPFSNSPEPSFFYQSTQHLGCLQQLELAIRLRRGLDVVIGDVGTGKTTLCREMIQRLSLVETDKEVFETHLILDPSFSDPLEFLAAVSDFFGVADSNGHKTEWQFKEEIKNALFQKGVAEGKITVLIIDEGQKLPGFCLEILREFLNFETNEYKLLQIVIFAQMEFEQVLKERLSLKDRINLHYHLKPLNFRETREMILFRLQKACAEGTQRPLALFTLSGFLAIYRETHGYPRKINTLCHQMLLAMIIQNRTRGGWLLARSCARRTSALPPRRFAWPVLAGFLILALAVVVGLFLWPIFTTAPKTFLSVCQSSDKKLDKISLVTIPSSYQNPTQAQEKKPAASSDGKLSTITTVESKETKSTQPAPALLGSLAVVKGRTVTSMLKVVYGDTDYPRMRAVLQANPEIEDMNHVVVGLKLRFPAIPSGERPPEGIIRVSISFEKTLEAAYEAIKKQSSRLPPVRLLPYWNQREGLVFAIILKESFTDKASAMETLQRLSPWLAGQACILDQWDRSTVFYGRM